MKTKTDFITNSSSSSFIITKDVLSSTQIFALLNYREFIETMGWKSLFSSVDDYWIVEENEGLIEGHTGMDNFSMHDFMEKIGINPDLAKWEY